MKKYLIVLSVILCACQARENEKDNTSSEIKPVEQRSVSGCYNSVFGKDSISISLTKTGDSISGPLSFHLYEKDKNDGYFSSVLKDSLLVGFYNFSSEGTYSVRQTVFKIAGDSILQGYGPIENKNDTMFFKNINSLHFMYDRPLVRTSCK